MFVLEDEEEEGSEEKKSQEMPILTIGEGEVLDLMKKLDAKKSVGTQWVLKECA